LEGDTKEQDMPVSARLDDETKALLEKTAKALQTTKTQVLKRSIREFRDKVIEQHSRTPYQLIKDLIGSEASGRGDLSVRGEEVLRERFRSKA